MNLNAIVTASISICFLAEVSVAESIRQISVTDDSYELAWRGVERHSYFIQASSDGMQTWNYLPVIEFGEVNNPLRASFRREVDEMYFRLVSTDLTTSNPEVADFDGDGLTNLEEIYLYQTSPFEFDAEIPELQNDTQEGGSNSLREASQFVFKMLLPIPQAVTEITLPLPEGFTPDHVAQISTQQNAGNAALRVTNWSADAGGIHARFSSPTSSEDFSLAVLLLRPSIAPLLVRSTGFRSTSFTVPLPSLVSSVTAALPVGFDKESVAQVALCRVSGDRELQIESWSVTSAGLTVELNSAPSHSDEFEVIVTLIKGPSNHALIPVTKSERMTNQTTLVPLNALNVETSIPLGYNDENVSQVTLKKLEGQGAAEIVGWSVNDGKVSARLKSPIVDGSLFELSVLAVSGQSH